MKQICALQQRVYGSPLPPPPPRAAGMGTAAELNGKSGGGNNSLRPPPNTYRAVPQNEGQKPPEDDEGCGFFCLRPRWMSPLANR